MLDAHLHLTGRMIVHSHPLHSSHHGWHNFRSDLIGVSTATAEYTRVSLTYQKRQTVKGIEWWGRVEFFPKRVVKDFDLLRQMTTPVLVEPSFVVCFLALAPQEVQPD
jgi:hypothetical protein